jgi:uncharacterized protein (TIGR04255 family)
MSNYPHLNNAPIAEAVVEIRVRMPRPIPPENFERFKDRLKDRFPRSQSIRFVASRLHFDGGDQVKNDVSNTLLGVRLDDAEGKWVVQAKSDGLAVSRLPPYESWDSLIATAKDVWPIYDEVFGPEAVLRLGTRYINRVPLPDSESVDLDAVLTAAPRIPPELPQSLSQFVTRVVLPIEAEGIELTILQSLEPSPVQHSLRRAHVVLDIDAACERVLAPTAPEMWGILDALRSAKNMAFFGSLTQQTWSRFQ